MTTRQRPRLFNKFRWPLKIFSKRLISPSPPLLFYSQFFISRSFNVGLFILFSRQTNYTPNYMLFLDFSPRSLSFLRTFFNSLRPYYSLTSLLSLLLSRSTMNHLYSRSYHLPSQPRHSFNRLSARGLTSFFEMVGRLGWSS